MSARIGSTLACSAGATICCGIDPVQAIIVNDLWALPLAFSVSGGAPVIFDSHEHWTSESATWTRWQRLSMRDSHEWIVDHEIPRTAGMMTVSQGSPAPTNDRVQVVPPW